MTPSLALVPPCAPIDADLPDLSRIAAVSAMTDPVQRNLWITYIYHRLELALGDRLGGDDVSWCAYGTWASKSAGRFIRGELVHALFGPLLARAPVLARVTGRIDGQIRDRIGRGNLMVFAELAPLFRRLIDLLDRPGDERGLAGAALLAELTPGPTEAGGQELLRRALATYLAAASTRDPKTRAEQILLANTLVGYHEQIRLQPMIAGALQAPLAVLVDVEAAPLRRMIGERLGELLRGVLTRWMMTIDLPEGALSLGRDVPATSDGRMFPAALARIEDPGLLAVLAQVDRTPDTTDGSAAADWASLGDRMNYIVDLFRSRQRDRTLRRPPFHPDQVEALHVGDRPAGPL